MVWAKLDDEILDNPKIARAGVFGFALHVAAITWCCRNLTDGFIPSARVTALLTLDRVNVDAANPLALIDGPRSMGGEEGLDPFVIAAHLVAVGLWRHVDGGYELNDFLTYNPSRAEVLSKREKNAERAERARSRKATKASHAASHGVTRTLRALHPDPDPDPDPVPDLRDPPPPRAREATLRGLRPDEPLTDQRRQDFESLTFNVPPRDVAPEWHSFVDDRISRSALFGSDGAIDADWRKWVRRQNEFSAERRKNGQRAGPPNSGRNVRQPHDDGWLQRMRETGTDGGEL